MSYHSGPGIWIARNKERQEHAHRVGDMQARIRRLEMQIRGLGHEPVE